MLPGQQNGSPGKKPAELSSFTVMISRGLGKVRSFSFTSRFLFLASIIFILYIAASVVGISLYFGALRKETIQADRVEKLVDETEETKRALYQARQRLKLLEDTICRIQGKEKKKAEILKPEAPKPVREEAVSQRKAEDNPAREASPEPLLGIERLTTKSSDGRLSVKFRLVKTASDKDQLNGYLFIIAGNTTTDPPRFWAYPKASLNHGVPVDYRRGQAFKVRNYRIIRGRFYLDSDTKTPQLLTILAYDAAGTLILNKAFAIEEAASQACMPVG